MQRSRSACRRPWSVPFGSTQALSVRLRASMPAEIDSGLQVQIPDLYMMWQVQRVPFHHRYGA